MAGRRRPPRLGPGATLGIVAPASPLYNRGDLARAAAVLERLGFRVKPGRHVHDRHGYLAGADQARAEDFMQTWLDPEVDGVLCLRGGYGCMRMVDRLDYAALGARPKAFVGYSDVTTLHLALGHRANLVTFYGPMVVTLARPGVSAYTCDGLLRALTGQGPLGAIPPDPDDPWVETVTGGVAEGELAGGCLTLLAHALGTPDDVDWRGKIVFIEDVDEEPYAIDRCLTQLLRAGRLDGVAGIVVAEPADCRPREYRPAFPSTLSLEDVIDERIRPLGVPAIYGLPLGHGRHLATVPLGVRARLDADAGRLEVLDPATA
jgi:muramoyltetrapeptide carboxypeptidase